MGDAQGQLTAFTHALERTCLLLACEDEGDLVLHILGAAHHVLFQCLVEDAIAIHGVVEVGNGLRQGLSREIVQQLLERTECHGALIEILGRLRCLQADAVLHEVIHAVMTRLVGIVGLAVQGVHHSHGAARIGSTLGGELGHGGDVGHQTLHIEGIGDALEDVAAARGGHQQIGGVDMTEAIALHGEGCTLQLEVIGGRGLHPQLLGIDLLCLHVGDGIHHALKILGVGDTVPHIVGRQHADGAKALLQLGIGHGRQEVLALQGILGQILVKEGGETIHKLIEDLTLEAPQVHRHDGLTVQMEIIVTILGVGGVLAALFNVGALGNALEVAVLHLAHATGDVAALGDGVDEVVAHHGVLVGGALFLEEVEDGLHGGSAVIIVGVQHGEGAIHGVTGAGDGVTRAPRLGAALGNGVALGNLIHLLEHVLHLEVLLHAIADDLAEISLDLLLDDKDHLAETGLPCIVHGKVDDDVALIVHRGDLLQAAETGAHAGCHNDQYRFSHNTCFSFYFIQYSLSLTYQMLQGGV